MAGKRILLPARTVAEWGGLHEYVEGAAKCLMGAGHEVTVVCGPGLLSQRLKAAGAIVLEVDWTNWRPEADRLRGLEPFDIVFAHATEGRDLALYVNEAWGAELYVMVHGAFHDFVYTWSEKVTAFLAASPSIVDFLVRIGKVPPWKIELVPNGVEDSVFNMRLESLTEKLSRGVGRIVMASRIDHDKADQFPVARQLLVACQELRPDVTWQLDVLGDGPLRPRIESEMNRFAARFPGIKINFHGWVAPEEVPRWMNGAVIGVVAGRGAIRTLAAGALCVGVGARGSVGLQVGQNLRAGLFSNFGDHGCPRFTPTSLQDDLRAWLQPGAYERAIDMGREAVRRGRSESVVNGTLLTALQCG